MDESCNQAEQTIGGKQAESPVYQQIKEIEDQLGQLMNTRHTLTERLSNVLTQPQPQTDPDSKKTQFESSLVEVLHNIAQNVEQNVVFLRDIINRLTI